MNVNLYDMKLPSKSYGTDESAAVGVWALLEAGQQEGVGRSGRALTPNVRNTELSSSCGEFVCVGPRSVNAAVHYS